MKNKCCFALFLFVVSLGSVLQQVQSFVYRTVSAPFQRRRQQLERRVPHNVLFGKASATTTVEVGPLIGSGSYGTVHDLTLDGDRTVTYVGKRPWKEEELLPADNNDGNNNNNANAKDPRERAQRCQYYWEVEAHCFSKLPPHPQIPPYFGTRDNWMVFGLVVGDDDDDDNYDESQQQHHRQRPAPTLADLMKLDMDKPQELIHMGKALGCSSYGETLDRVLESLLQVLMHVHEHKIVHRDIKPSNLLVSNNHTLVLMDFGSAADLEPMGGMLLQRRKGLENGSRVAVSPFYCAPEVFIDVHKSPTTFDIFSSALLFCQLLFSYLDSRMDAGFHQQLEATKWDLNLWLENELGSKLRPGGLEHALEYLRDRPGLWTLLQHMFAEDPMDRPDAKQAFGRFQKILKGQGLEDSPYFTMLLEATETCEIPTMSRPLHFVATFSRGKPLGLVLSEKDDDDDEEADDPFWQEATKDAEDGEVFVKEIVPGGQADGLGIFEIGDRLDGIGELPFSTGGFERAIEMVSTNQISTNLEDWLPVIPYTEYPLSLWYQSASRPTEKRSKRPAAFRSNSRPIQ
jgi:serine/threonine protein kinase